MKKYTLKAVRIMKFLDCTEDESKFFVEKFKLTLDWNIAINPKKIEVKGEVIG